MIQPVLAAFGTVLLLFSFLAARRARRLFRLTRTLARLTTVSIADARGFTRVLGRAGSDAPIPSAFQRRPCLYYAYRVEDPGDARKKERRLAVGKDWAAIHIDDGSGTIGLEGRAALIRAPREHATTLEGLTAVPSQHAEFFEAAGITERHVRRFPRLRITEYTLEPGDEVHVTGTVREEDGRKTFYRAPRSPLVVTPETDTGLAPGYRHEQFLFSGAAVLLLAFAALFWFVSVA